MDELAERSPGGRLRRLRWRMSGAWLWPTFVVATLLEMGLLHWLPIAGEGSGLIAALLLAGSLNVIAIALLGRWLRRRRPELPKVVADDRAGTAVVVAVAVAIVAAGLANRDEVRERERDLAAQSAAVHGYVMSQAPAEYRRGLAGADTLRLEEDRYRTCVPGADPKRWLCLIVDTSQRPPRVRRDTSRESNASQNPRGVFR